MKLLKVSFLLILIALITLRKKPGRNIENNPTNQKSPPNHQQAIAQNKPNFFHLPQSEPHQPTAHDEEWHRQQRENWQRQLWPQWAMVVITAGGVIVAAVTLGILNQTLIATKDAVQAAKDQAIAARNATTIAKEAFEQQVRTFEQDQRAWISLKGIKLLNPLQANKPLSARGTLINTGKTPAFETGAAATVVATHEPLNIDKFRKLGRKIDPKIPSKATFPSNIDWFLDASTTEPLSEQEVQGIKINRFYIYYFGDVTYFDAFGNSRSTQFCGIYDPTSNDFSLCKEHNHAN
jgi:hypothetical protein